MKKKNAVEESLTTIEPLFDWQVSQWQNLCDQIVSNRLPHALLFQGPAGVGKLNFTFNLIQLLLCRSPLTANNNLQACGHCKSCHLFSAGTHPDIAELTFEESAKMIKISQVRNLLNFVSQTAQQGGRKCVIIHPADAMNIAATNALLKALEEPQGDTVFILITANPSSLLATVRSRCQRIVFPLPAEEQALSWLGKAVGEKDAASVLRLAHGAPLRAMEAFREDWQSTETELMALLDQFTQGKKNLIPAAKQLADIDSAMEDSQWVLNRIQQWLDRVIASRFVKSSVAKELAAWFGQASDVALFGLRDAVLETQRLAASSANLNRQMLWERLLQDWQKAVSGRV